MDVVAHPANGIYFVTSVFDQSNDVLIEFMTP